MRNRNSILTLIVFLLVALSQEISAQCYSGQAVTAAFATGGSSVNKDKVLWLTWGSTNQKTHPYGKTETALVVGSKSYASIPLGDGKYLCVESEITAIANVSGNSADDRAIQSYIPGTYVGDGVNSGDFLDILYNIGGARTPQNEPLNKMVSGIRNTKNGGGSVITIKSKATIDGVPIRLAGMVVADAESLAGDYQKPERNWGVWSDPAPDPTREYIYAKAKGTWHVVEIQKNLSEGSYWVRKENNSATEQTIKFLGGNDKKTGAVAFLAFNESAYNTTGNNPDLGVSFTATLKGGGLTALALGLLNPSVDLGDAPESYGSPIHLLQSLTFSNDGIPAVASNASNQVKRDATKDINLPGYNPGRLVPTEGSYLGSTPPDGDKGTMFSKDALGDDNTPVENVLMNEEDAWPVQYRRFSYKAHYMPGNNIVATIPYKGAKVGSKISGWIDFNLNGKFDSDERVTATVGGNGNGSVVLKWTVPSVRRPYSTYVRLRYFDVSESDATSPTSNVNFGEVEDHRIYILGPTLTNPMLPSKAKN